MSVHNKIERIDVDGLFDILPIVDCYTNAQTLMSSKTTLISRTGKLTGICCQIRGPENRGQ